MNRKEVIERNVNKLSEISDVENKLSKTHSLPSVEVLHQVVELSKQIIFPD